MNQILNQIALEGDIDIAAQPQQWMQTPSMAKPQSIVDADQLTSLSAMIAYMAVQSGQSEFRIERALADHFGIANAKFLPAIHFDLAMQYLVDLAPA